MSTITRCDGCRVESTNGPTLRRENGWTTRVVQYHDYDYCPDCSKRIDGWMEELRGSEK